MDWVDVVCPIWPVLKGVPLWTSFLRKDVGLNKTEKAVLRLLIEDSNKTADVIAAETGVIKRTIGRTFVSLQKRGKIERIGYKRDEV